MKVSTVHMQQLAALIEPLDTPGRRGRYLKGDFGRSYLVKDLNYRYRWDLFWAAEGHHVVGDCGYLDTHIDTALRHIIPDVYPHEGVPWRLSVENLK